MKEEWKDFKLGKWTETVDVSLFIKENYNIEPLLSEKFKWEHKKEFYIRHFFNKMVMTSNPPPMK